MPNYNVMAVAKAALETCARYLAVELGPQGIRVNCISAGPIRTLAASGVAGFKTMHSKFKDVAPLRRPITIEDVGNAAVWLCSDLASATTGEVLFVDGGVNVLAIAAPDERQDAAYSRSGMSTALASRSVQRGLRRLTALSLIRCRVNGVARRRLTRASSSLDCADQICYPVRQMD